MSKTLANIRTEVAYRLGDSTFAIWASLELDAYIAQGYDEFCIQSRILWKRTNTGMDDVAAQALYTLPTDLYQVERVSYKNQRIEPVSRAQAMSWDIQFESTRGRVMAWMHEGDGLRSLRKIRIPDVVGTSGDTQLEYWRRGAALSGSNFEIPDYMTKYIRFYAMAKALDRDGKGQDTEAAEHYRGRFQTGIVLAVGRVDRAQSARVRTIGHDGRRLRKPPRPVLPSNYPR